jgi:hypothetical protein
VAVLGQLLRSLCTALALLFTLLFHLQASRNASIVFPLELKSLTFVYLRGSPPAVLPFLTRFAPQFSESFLQQPYQQLNNYYQPHSKQ